MFHKKRLFKEYWLFFARVYTRYRHKYTARVCGKNAWLRLNCDFIQQDMFYEKNAACWEPVRRYDIREYDSVNNTLQCTLHGKTVYPCDNITKTAQLRSFQLKIKISSVNCIVLGWKFLFQMLDIKILTSDDDGGCIFYSMLTFVNNYCLQDSYSYS